MKHKKTLVIGIDPGTNCGVAIKDLDSNNIKEIFSTSTYKAIKIVEKYAQIYNVFIRIEDARKVVYFTDPKKTQGAGYVKAYTKIWEQEIKDFNLYYQFVRPSIQKKWTAYELELYTGYTKRTNNHGRDAAKLIWNVNPRSLQMFKHASQPGNIVNAI